MTDRLQTPMNSNLGKRKSDGGLEGRDCYRTEVYQGGRSGEKDEVGAQRSPTTKQAVLL